jgi:hypothetical protein
MEAWPAQTYATGPRGEFALPKPKPDAEVQAMVVKAARSRRGDTNLAVRLGLVSREEEAVRDAACARKERIARQARELAKA